MTRAPHLFVALGISLLGTSVRSAAPVSTPASPANAEPAKAPAPTFRWDIPGTQKAIQVGDTLWVRGRPMTLYAVRSKWKAPDLRHAILQQFGKAKFYLPPEQRKALPGVPLQHVTGVDPKTEIAYTALLQPEPDGTTTLYLGAVAGGPRRDTGSSNIAPLFPGAKHVLESNFEGMQALSFAAPATADEVELFFRTALAKAGYTVDKDSLTFRRPDNVLRVQLGMEREGLLPVVVLSTAVAPAPELPR